MTSPARFHMTSIRRKLTAILVVAGAVPVLIASALLTGYGIVRTRTDLTEELSALAEVAAFNIAPPLAFELPEDASRILAGLRPKTHIVAACIYDARGGLFAFYSRTPSAAPCPARTGHGEFVSHSRAGSWRPVSRDGETIGSIYIEAELASLYSRLQAYILISGAVLIGGLCGIWFLMAGLQRIISRPILDLAETARLVSAKNDYSLRARKASEDEVGTLVDAFNYMLSQVDAHASELSRVNRELLDSKVAVEHAADALARSERRFRSTFDEAPLGMNLMDEHGRILESNHTLQEMLGYGRDELCGKRVSDLLHSVDAADSSWWVALLDGSRASTRIEKRCVRKDGQTIWVRMTVFRLPTASGDFLATAMTENLTDRKELEEQFRQAQKMEAVGRLAGGVAHDFNNLLTVIKGNAELAIRRLPPEHSLHRNLGQVGKAADRASALVDQLLAFSRKQLLDPKVLDLNDAVRDLETMLRRLIGEDIDLAASYGPSNAYINADPVQLEQIVLNLAVNARDAMPEGGVLSIRTGSVYVDQAPARNPDMLPGQYIILSVTDTGTGMSEEVRSHIFEPFFTTKEVGKGTGLGLSTVYGIVQQSGGYISVDSEPGRGSTFTIFFPKAAAPKKEGGEDGAAQSVPECRGETVLVVEDEEAVRAMLCEALTERGYSVLEAANGEDAIEVARRCTRPIQLLVTDFVMPRLNGREMARKILSQRPDTKVLYISGYTNSEAAFGSTFLRKPFTPDELAAKVREVLEQKSL